MQKLMTAKSAPRPLYNSAREFVVIDAVGRLIGVQNTLVMEPMHSMLMKRGVMNGPLKALNPDVPVN